MENNTENTNQVDGGYNEAKIVGIERPDKDIDYRKSIYVKFDRKNKEIIYTTEGMSEDEFMGFLNGHVSSIVIFGIRVFIKDITGIYD